MRYGLKDHEWSVIKVILRDAGSGTVAKAVGYSKRKAIMTVGMDIALMYAGNAILQTVATELLGTTPAENVDAASYWRRLQGFVSARPGEPARYARPAFRRQTTSARCSRGARTSRGRKTGRLSATPPTVPASICATLSAKIGEEFVGWPTDPIDMLRRKVGTITGPLTQLFSDDDGFGRQVYDPDASTLEDHGKNIGRIARLFLGNQIPLQSVQAAKDYFSGHGDPTVSALQTVGPMLGFTFSKAYPGGPKAGEDAAILRKQKLTEQEKPPDDPPHDPGRRHRRRQREDGRHQHGPEGADEADTIRGT
jgi:hypothetical protein